MLIAFTKSKVSGRYNVTINGRPAGEIHKENATSKPWWVYQCKGNHEGQPALAGIERTRHWAVRNAVLDVLLRADNVKDYFAL